MPFILRKIRKAKWYKTDGVAWLAESELQADALGDLMTKGNRLSVYLVDDDQSNLEEVIAALATANTDYISDFDFALFNQEILEEINIKAESTVGDTPDVKVNSRHYDLVELTAAKIMALATTIQIKAERRRVLRKRVRDLVIGGVTSHNLDRAKFKANLIKELKPHLDSEEFDGPQ